MDGRTILRSRVLFAFGLLGLLIATIDPLEGAPLLLAATAALTLAAFLRRSPARKLFFWALPLVAFGFGIVVATTAVGGIGGHRGLATWWRVLFLPYAAGWLLAVVGTVREVVDQFHGARVHHA